MPICAWDVDTLFCSSFCSPFGPRSAQGPSNAAQLPTKVPPKGFGNDPKAHPKSSKVAPSLPLKSALKLLRNARDPPPTSRILEICHRLRIIVEAPEWTLYMFKCLLVALE